MRTSRRSGVDRDTADRLLDGAAVGGSERLNLLLAAAAAPGRPDELTGEAAAVDAFRAQRAGTLAVAPARRPRPRTGAGRLLTVKAGIAAALAVAATGGVALAATTGVLPGPFDGGFHRELPDGTPTPAGPTTGSSPGAPSGTPGGATGGGTVTPAPDPALVGLCRAYRAAGDRDRVLDTPAFRSLVLAAGNRNAVPAYCAAVLTGRDAAGTPHPTGKPAHPSNPPGRSTPKPEKSARPSSAPTNPAGQERSGAGPSRQQQVAPDASAGHPGRPA
ncbi:hypothetical protein AB0J86_27900 [Micromonospora sp. NPDC049559]|uniref:hypothetical protein n=1 Tax=Micromonospora sp. NPDC049559 TaxID=3155923 RepID=UPI00343A85C6